MDVEDLINLVKQHEAIYNPQSSKYRDYTLRSAAWEEISKAMKKPVDECREQWTKLRNCFNNAMKRRERKSVLYGKKLAPWRYEEQMAFIRPLLNYHTVTGSPCSPEGLAFSEHISFLESMPSLQIDHGESPVSPQYEIKKSPSHRYLNDALAEINNTEKVTQKYEEMDDIDHFFISMSKTVKQLPKIEQIRLKMEIHRLINEAELRQLESEENAKKFKYT